MHWIKDHIEAAKTQLNEKPLVLQEFNLPAQRHGGGELDAAEVRELRREYYSFVSGH